MVFDHSYYQNLIDIFSATQYSRIFRPLFEKKKSYLKPSPTVSVYYCGNQFSHLLNGMPYVCRMIYQGQFSTPFPLGNFEHTIRLVLMIYFNLSSKVCLVQTHLNVVWRK